MVRSSNHIFQELLPLYKHQMHSKETSWTILWRSRSCDHHIWRTTLSSHSRIPEKWPHQSWRCICKPAYTFNPSILLSRNAIPSRFSCNRESFQYSVEGGEQHTRPEQSAPQSTDEGLLGDIVPPGMRNS